MNKSLALAVVLTILWEGSRVEGRTWTDSTGQYTLEADFVDMTAGIVRLKKDTGSIIRIPMEKLSAADQRFVKMRARQSTVKSHAPSVPRQGAAAGPNGTASGAAAKAAFRSRRVEAYTLGMNMLLLGLGDEASARRSYPLMRDSAKYLEIEVPVSLRDLPAQGDKNAKFPLLTGAAANQFPIQLLAVSAQVSQRHGSKVGAAFNVGWLVKMLLVADLSALSAKTRKQWLASLDTQGKTAGIDQKDLSEFIDKLKTLPGAAERTTAGFKFILQVFTQFEREDKKEAGP